jgi:hypothetical protein
MTSFAYDDDGQAEVRALICARLCLSARRKPAHPHPIVAMTTRIDLVHANVRIIRGQFGA